MVVLRATSLFGENKLRPAARVIKASCRPVFWLYTSSVLEKAAVSSQQSAAKAHQTNLLIREEKDTASKKQEHNKLIPRTKKEQLWVHSQQGQQRMFRFKFCQSDKKYQESLFDLAT